jgi:hypothetical protein
VAGWFPEISLGALGVAGPVDEAEAFKRFQKWFGGFQPGN